LRKGSDVLCAMKFSLRSSHEVIRRDHHLVTQFDLLAIILICLALANCLKRPSSSSAFLGILYQLLMLLMPKLWSLLPDMFTTRLI